MILSVFSPDIALTLIHPSYLKNNSATGNVFKIKPFYGRVGHFKKVNDTIDFHLIEVLLMLNI